MDGPLTGLKKRRMSRKTDEYIVYFPDLSVGVLPTCLLPGVNLVERRVFRSWFSGGHSRGPTRPPYVYCLDLLAGLKLRCRSQMQAQRCPEICIFGHVANTTRKTEAEGSIEVLCSI